MCFSAMRFLPSPFFQAQNRHALVDVLVSFPDEPQSQYNKETATGEGHVNHGRVMGAQEVGS